MLATICVATCRQEGGVFSCDADAHHMGNGELQGLQPHLIIDSLANKYDAVAQ